MNTPQANAYLPLVTIAVINYNGKHFLEPCFSSLKSTSYSHCEFYLIDNGSSDGSVEYTRNEFPWVKIHRIPTNTGFCGGANAALSVTRGEFLAIVNNDTRAPNDWLTPLVETIQTDERAIAVWGYDLPSELWEYRHKLHIDLSKIAPVQDTAMIGTVQLYRVSLLKKLGYHREEFFGPWSDYEVSFRARRQGYRVLFCPGGYMFHSRGGTDGGFQKVFSAKKKNDYNAKWFYHIYHDEPIWYLYTLSTPLLLWRLLRWFPGKYLYFGFLRGSKLAREDMNAALSHLWKYRTSLWKKRRQIIRAFLYSDHEIRLLWRKQVRDLFPKLAQYGQKLMEDVKSRHHS